MPRARLLRSPGDRCWPAWVKILGPCRQTASSKMTAPVWCELAGEMGCQNASCLGGVGHLAACSLGQGWG